jgi:hypothetical protein
MGANATTTVPVYASGEVLTAADLNITNSGIPVFSGTATRDAAFGGTGEKTLAEGQFAFLEDSNSTQFYDGAAWQSVGVSPGMVLVGSASPSAVSSVSINNCFTSTYENYRVVGTVSAATGATGELTLRLRAGGTDTTTNYTGQLFEAYSSTSTSTLKSGLSSWYITNIDTTTDDSVFSYDIYAPQTATKTRYTGQAMYTTSVFVSQTNAGVQTATTQFDGITILFSGTNFTGNIRVYGYANS